MKRRTLLKYALSAVPLSSSYQLLPTNTKKESSNTTTMKIQRLAWAGIKIETDKTTLFVDATSYEEQKDMKLKAGTELVHGLITHHHPDHYDAAALKTVFNTRSRLYCHEDTWPWIDATDMRTQAVKLHQPVDVSRWTGDLVAIPVPAVDGFGHPQVSWVVQSGGKKIIHCGDTLWHGYWRDIAIAYGPFDVAFMPINAARLSQGKVTDTGIPAVLGPEQAVVAAKLLNAKLVCPIHYGRTSDTYFETPDPEGNFLRFAKERGVNTRVMRVGEYLEIGD